VTVWWELQGARQQGARSTLVSVFDTSCVPTTRVNPFDERLVRARRRGCPYGGRDRTTGCRDCDHDQHPSRLSDPPRV